MSTASSKMISSKIKLRVQSVRSVKDPEKREAFQIEFVEVRSKPPMVMMSNPDVPNEINQMVVQVTKSFQGIIPGSQDTTYEQRKLTLILTGEELESLNMKPYPNQLYEMVISDKAMSFKQILS
ncbi:MAG: arcadin 1 [Candidatus Bathyarchaeota archaeon]